MYLEKVKSNEWAILVNLPSGINGTKKTLDAMKMFYKRDVSSDLGLRLWVMNLVALAKGHNFRHEIEIIFAYCRDKIRYRRDPVEAEFLQDARRTIELGFGDCDDKTLLFCTLAGLLGHRTRLKVVAYQQKQKFQHVYAEVLINGKWIAADATPETSQLGWEAPNIVDVWIYAL